MGPFYDPFRRIYEPTRFSDMVLHDKGQKNAQKVTKCRRGEYVGGLAGFTVL